MKISKISGANVQENVQIVCTETGCILWAESTEQAGNLFQRRKL